MVTTPNFTDGTWTVASTAHIAGDPNGDILWQNIADQSLVLWQQSGATTTVVTELPSLDGYEVAVVGDFDGDGKADPLIRSGNENRMVLSESGAISGFFNTGFAPAAATDLNGDGMDDLITISADSTLIATRFRPCRPIWSLSAEPYRSGAVRWPAPLRNARSRAKETTPGRLGRLGS